MGISRCGGRLTVEALEELVVAGRTDVEGNFMDLGTSARMPPANNCTFSATSGDACSPAILLI